MLQPINLNVILNPKQQHDASRKDKTKTLFSLPRQLSSCLSLCMFQKLTDQLVSTTVKGLGMVYQLLIPADVALQRLIKGLKKERQQMTSIINQSITTKENSITITITIL